MASGTRWTRVLLASILIVYVIMSVAYNVLQPIGEAPDEPAHVEFVQYIQQHRALPLNPPDAPAHLGALAPGIEFDQVPLYYVVLAAVLSPVWLPPGARLHRDPFIGWPGHPWQRANDLHWLDEGWPYHGLSLFVHLGRLISILFGLVTVLTAYGLLQMIAGSSAALFGTAWIACGPGFLLTSSRINNDNAATAASTAVLFGSVYLLTASHPSRYVYAGVSLALAIALLSKVHALFVVPLVVVAVAGAIPRTWPRFTAWSKVVAGVAAVLAPGLGVLGIWWLSVGHTYDRRLDVAVGVGVADVGSWLGAVEWQRLPMALSWFNSTWWGGIGAGVETLWDPAFYGLLAVPVLILITSGVVAIGRGSVAHWPPKRCAACLLVVDAVPLFYATISRQVFPWVGLDANSRFFLPAASTIALLVTVGGMSLPLGRARRPLAVGYLAGILALSIATAVYLLPRISAPTIPARLAASPGEASSTPLATFAGGVELLSVDNVPRTLTPGTAVPLRLRWRATRTPQENFIVFTHLIGREDEGRVAAGHDEIPFEREFPPTLWQAGEIVEQRQDLTLLRAIGPGIYSLQIGMYHLQGDNVTPVPITSPTTTPDRVVIATWKVLPTIDPEKNAHLRHARFGDDLMLLGQSVSADAVGTRVTLTWQALRTPTRRLVVSAQVLDPSGQLVAQYDGEPVDGRLPTTSWEAGDTVQDTYVAAGTPLRSDLSIIVAVYDRETHLRLPVIEAGHADADHITLAR